ncbi:MAG: RluA family pseudouridine synthase [Pseudomonadota bacterium]|nr:RluA family pseudouridine synthase [Pseudomonadota bacterium]
MMTDDILEDDDGPELDGPADGANDTVALTVPDEAEGTRLDRYLADALPDLSRSRVQALLKDGYVRSESGATVSDASARVKRGAGYTVTVPAPEAALPEPQAIPLSILHEDAHLIVVDKPAGMVVHPAPGNRDGTLVNALLHHCGDSLMGIGGVLRPGIVHRIDKDTSGLLVAAKSDKAHAGLAALFAEHAIERLYRAIVIGVPEPVQGTIDQNIGRHPTDRIRFATVSEFSGKTAVTHYRLLAQSDMAVAEIECRLETGRTHQIRVHMASTGHPLIGDPLYGRSTRTRRAALSKEKRMAADAFPRQALHAATLAFRHPVTGQDLSFASEPPDDYLKLRMDLGLASG